MARLLNKLKKTSRQGKWKLPPPPWPFFSIVNKNGIGAYSPLAATRASLSRFSHLLSTYKNRARSVTIKLKSSNNSRLKSAKDCLDLTAANSIPASSFKPPLANNSEVNSGISYYTLASSGMNLLFSSEYACARSHSRSTWRKSPCVRAAVSPSIAR